MATEAKDWQSEQQEGLDISNIHENQIEKRLPDAVLV